MARWIVAGVLLAVLVVLLVTDEFGYTPDGPELAASPEVPGVVSEPPPAVEQEPEDSDRQVAAEACEPVVAKLIEAGGEEVANAIGDALYETKGMTPDQVRALCVELAGASGADILARMSAEAGVTP